MSIQVFRRLIVILILHSSLFTLHSFAQERESTHTTLFGIGRVNHLDTYLSPVEYKGPQLTFLNETHRTLQRNGHVVFQTVTQGDFSYAHNRAAISVGDASGRMFCGKASTSQPAAWQVAQSDSCTTTGTATIRRKPV